MMPLIANTWPAFSATRIRGMNQKRLNCRTGSPKLGNAKAGSPIQDALCTPSKLIWHADLAAWQAGSTSETRYPTTTAKSTGSSRGKPRR